MHSIFNTPDEVVAILQRLSRSASARSTSCSDGAKKARRETLPQTQADAHKLGEVACWQAWGSRANLSFKGHAGRGAPHYFRLCRREDIGMPLDDQGHDISSERSSLNGST